MSSLISAAEQKTGLKKAGDATHDPADLTASVPASRNADGNAVPKESGKAGGKEIAVASGSASKSASKPAGVKASRKDGATASTRARSKIGKKASDRAGRRVGRPAGPGRTMLSVRILDEIDERLTLAVEQTGLSPQQIVDAALPLWFEANDVPNPPR